MALTVVEKILRMVTDLAKYQPNGQQEEFKRDVLQMVIEGDMDITTQDREELKQEMQRMSLTQSSSTNSDK